MVAATKPGSKLPDEWSPNQIAKRDHIVKSTARLMTRDGVKACTARAVSGASDISTSALHYYFNDLDEINELAFAYIARSFFSALDAIAEESANPTNALWNVACGYLSRGTDVGESVQEHKRAPLLWFEFHAECMRNGKLDLVRKLSKIGADLFEGLLRDLDVDDAPAASEALYCALLGATVRNSLLERPVEDFVEEIFVAQQLPLPPGR